MWREKKVWKMSKAGVKFSEIKEQLMKDDEFRAEYERLLPRYEVISQIIAARAEQHLTQEELALRVGTHKSNISRLESGAYNPSLDFLAKVAQGLGKEVHIALTSPRTALDDEGTTSSSSVSSS
jgi:DNA-binding XRE family transcriptional regulator